MPTNEEIAEILDQIAELLHGQSSNPFRIMAYQRAAETVRSFGDRIEDVVRTEGVDGLKELPAIGESLARLIAEIAETGASSLLARLQGQASPEEVFATVPGIGKRLATLIHERLGIETLEELEAAAHDGRLAELPGFGPRRLRGIAEALAGRLGKRSRRITGDQAHTSVVELLDIDREYRTGAAQGSLRRIAPRRFNPQGESWPPHTPHPEGWSALHRDVLEYRPSPRIGQDAGLGRHLPR